MIYNPMPGGNDAEAEHHREIYRQTNTALPLRSSSAVKVQRSTTGTFLRVRTPAPAPGGQVKQYKIVTDQDSDCGDYLVCYTWDGTNLGTTAIKVAKPPKIRVSLASEAYIDGTGTHTFSYAAVMFGGFTAAYTRTNTWGAGTQAESATPDYLPGDIVYAISCPALQMPQTPGSGTMVAVSLLDIHARHWAL